MHKKGFTIVELMIVIVVIGILAAITIVAYTGVQSRAQDTARQAESKQIESAVLIKGTRTGQFSATSEEIASNQAFFNTYELGALANTINLGAGCASNCNREQIYLYPNAPGGSLPTPGESIAWWYWSNAENTWILTHVENNGNRSSQNWDGEPIAWPI